MNWAARVSNGCRVIELRPVSILIVPWRSMIFAKCCQWINVVILLIQINLIWFDFDLSWWACCYYYSLHAKRYSSFLGLYTVPLALHQLFASANAFAWQTRIKWFVIEIMQISTNALCVRHRATRRTTCASIRVADTSARRSPAQRASSNHRQPATATSELLKRYSPGYRVAFF